MPKVVHIPGLILWIVTLVLQACGQLSGQTTFGTITGASTDASGAFIPNVEVTTTHVATNITARANNSARYDVRDFGAKGDFETNDRAAIQATIDACHKGGGGTVVIPPGRYLSGTLLLRSHVTLKIENGATLYASKQKEDYAGNEPALIVADGVDDIAIVGKGTIHGQAPDDYGARWGVPEDGRFRRHTLRIQNSRNVTLRDFKILYSDLFSVTLKRCDTVVIDGLTILNNIRHLNSDGIDAFSCRNLHISNTHVVAGDDAIVLKSDGEHPTENVVVTNCTLETMTTGVKVGTGTSGDFRNVHFSNLTIKAPSGIGFYVKDGGTVEQFTFSNISIETPPRTVRGIVPIFMDIERRHPHSRLGHIRDISFRDIFIRSGSGVLIQGMPERPIENLSIDNLTFRVENPDSYAGRSKPIGGLRTTRNERDTKYIRIPAYLTFAHVNGLHLDKVRVFQTEEAKAKYDRSAFSVQECKDVLIDGKKQ